MIFCFMTNSHAWNFSCFHPLIGFSQGNYATNIKFLWGLKVHKYAFGSEVVKAYSPSYYYTHYGEMSKHNIIK